MGLLEIHFHDSEIDFRPSMRIGPTTPGSPDAVEEGEEPESDAPRTGDTRDELRFPMDEAEGSRKRDLLVAILLLGVLVVLRNVLQNREIP